jgi:hypothetical protein
LDSIWKKLFLAAHTFAHLSLTHSLRLYVLLALYLPLAHSLSLRVPFLSLYLPISETAYFVIAAFFTDRRITQGVNEIDFCCKIEKETSRQKDQSQDILYQVCCVWSRFCPISKVDSTKFKPKEGFWRAELLFKVGSKKDDFELKQSFLTTSLITVSFIREHRYKRMAQYRPHKTFIFHANSVSGS